MSAVQLNDLGDGKFQIEGQLTFDSVADALDQSKVLFDQYDRLEVDLGAVDKSDSAGLALLLEWINWAKYYVREIRFSNIPAQIQAIAQISEVDEMLSAGERWTGPVQEPAG